MVSMDSIIIATCTHYLCLISLTLSPSSSLSPWPSLLLPPTLLLFLPLHLPLFCSLFSGHKSSIKSICVLDSEHLFVSGSKDKTVKIWSLHNHGGGSSLLPPRLTYLHHQKPIVKIDVINSHQNVLSCDGSLHVRMFSFFRSPV